MVFNVFEILAKATVDLSFFPLNPTQKNKGFRN